MAGTMRCACTRALQVGRADAAVLDAVAQALARAPRAGRAPWRSSVCSMARSPTACTVHWKPCAVRAAEQVVELLLLPVEDAAVLAVRGVGLARGRGGPARRAVGHHLEGAQPQPLVAEAGVHAGAEQAHQRMLAAVHGGERVDAHARAGRASTRSWPGANAGPTRPPASWTLVPPAARYAASARSSASRNSSARRHAPPPAAASAPSRRPRRGCGRPRGRSARRRGSGVASVDAGPRQRPAVHRRDVAARAREDHRMLGRHGVPVEPVRMALLGQARLVVAAPADPRARRLVGRPLRAPPPAARAIDCIPGALQSIEVTGHAHARAGGSARR